MTFIYIICMLLLYNDDSKGKWSFVTLISLFMRNTETCMVGYILDFQGVSVYIYIQNFL